MPFVGLGPPLGWLQPRSAPASTGNAAREAGDDRERDAREGAGEPRGAAGTRSHACIGGPARLGGPPDPRSTSSRGRADLAGAPSGSIEWDPPPLPAKTPPADLELGVRRVPVLADVEPVDLLVRGHPDSSETSFVTYQKTIESRRPSRR